MHSELAEPFSGSDVQSTAPLGNFTSGMLWTPRPLHWNRRATDDTMMDIPVVRRLENEASYSINIAGFTRKITFDITLLN